MLIERNGCRYDQIGCCHLDGALLTPYPGGRVICNAFLMIEPFKKKSITRLKQAQGQLEGIISMIEKDEYCADIISQVLAIQGLLKGVPPLILESHLTTCGAEHLTSPSKAKREKFIKEIVRTCELSTR